MSDSEKQSVYLDPENSNLDRVVYPDSGELVLGVISAILDNGQALVSYQLGSSKQTIPAIATIELHAQQIGRQVGILFAKAPEYTPVIVGLIHNPLHGILDTLELAERNDDQELFEGAEHEAAELKAPSSDESLLVDGKRVVIEGKDEVVLKCGEASITLNKNGKISIRGKYLLNRSTGINRIMGGSVQVN